MLLPGRLPGKAKLVTVKMRGRNSSLTVHLQDQCEVRIQEHWLGLTLADSPPPSIHVTPPPPAMHAHTNFTLQGPTQPWIISSRPSGTCSTASLSTTRTLAAASRLYTTSCSLPPNVGLCVCVCVFMSHANP